MAELTAQLVSPERMLYSGEAEMVVCRTSQGEIAFLPGHVPFVGALGEGAVRVVHTEGKTVAAVHGGFVEVANDRVTVLSDLAELSDQIDIPRARAAQQRARESLRSDPDDQEAQAALVRAELRLDVAGVTPGP